MTIAKSPLSRLLLLFSALALSFAFSNAPSAHAEFADNAVDEAVAAATADKKGDDKLAFCHSQKWSVACLTALLAYRCEEYTYPLIGTGCALTSVAFVNRLNLTRVDVEVQGTIYNLPVIFIERLTKMIQEPGVQSEIKELRMLLEQNEKTRTPFSIWNWILEKKAGDKEKALEWLSVLLQDTSPVQIQIVYLQKVATEQKFPSATNLAINSLGEIAYFLQNDNLGKVDYQSWLKLYPEEANLDPELTPLVYHFYPMAYLGFELKKAGAGNRLASFVPFLFNTEYLLQDLDPARWPLRHPRASTVDLKDPRIQWKMRDMYGGFTGGLFGVDKLSKAKGLENFQTHYAKNPFWMMRTLFWTMP